MTEKIVNYEVKGLISEIEFLDAELQKYKEKETTKKLESRIYDLLYQLHIPAQIKGFKYIVAAVKEVYDEDYYKIMNVYKEIGKKNNDSSSKVERSIRHAIEAGWSNNKDAFLILNKYMKERPNISEFLALVTNYLRMNE